MSALATRVRQLPSRLGRAGRAVAEWLLGREPGPILVLEHGGGLICPLGLTERQVRTLLGSEARWVAFEFWMRGQMFAVCDGYDHDESWTYQPSPCAGHPHGVVYYRQDVDRFMRGLAVID